MFYRLLIQEDVMLATVQSPPGNIYSNISYCSCFHNLILAFLGFYFCYFVAPC